jgi:SAM-dependent methyltransferase
MIEHCQSPIESIENWLRVLKPGGVLFMAVPDKRYTFDVHRAITPLGHVVRDYREGPQWSRSMHFREVVSGDANSNDTSRSEDEIAAAAQRLSDDDYSIHFHVWTQAEFLQLLLYCRHDLCFGFDIELFQKNGIEFIIVLPQGRAPADENAFTLKLVREVEATVMRVIAKPGFPYEMPHPHTNPGSAPLILMASPLHESSIGL